MTSNTIDRGVANKFNRGEVAPEAFGREDVARLQNSCELMENFQPERLGPMRYRPGSEIILFQTLDDQTKMIPFNTDLADPVMLFVGEETELPAMTFMRQDALIEWVDTTTGWDNGTFTTGFAAGEWINADEGSATSVIASGNLVQTGTGPDAAKAYQTSDTTDTGVAHMLDIRVTRGSVLVQVGENGVDSSDLFEAKFEVGHHFIEITPSAAFTVTISNDSTIPSRVDQAELLDGTPTPITVGLEDALDVSVPTGGTMETLHKLRWAPSANIQYFCGDGWIPFQVRRHGDRSFSVERFVNQFGPYEDLNISSITMNPVAPIDGDTQIETNRRYWDNVYDPNKGFAKGTLLKLAITGQTQTVTGSANGTATTGVFIFGTGDARQFTVTFSGTTGTFTDVELQKSFDEITWQKVKSYTGGDQTEIYNDELDGAEIYYRLEIVDNTGLTTTTMTVSYDYGTLEAQGRIREVTGSGGTDVQVQWYVPLNEDQTVRDWYIGSWGGRRPFPTAIALYEGRLWFAAQNKVWGSESDFYESFDRNVEGASASIQRSIGFGSSKNILWLAPSARLVMGTELSEIDIRSDSFGTVLTPDNTNLKEGSTRGCADVAPLVLDQEVIFVQKGGKKILGIDFNIQSEKHAIEDFNMLHPKIFGDAKVVSMAYVTTPEQRIYMVLDDGSVRALLRDAAQDVLAWYRMELVRDNSIVEDIKDVAVLPGEDEDSVYFTTKDGGSFGSLIKLANADAADGSSASKHFDRWVYYPSPGTTISVDPVHFGLVSVWADGADRGDFAVSGGSITVPSSWTDVVIGYRYLARYKSPKLGDYTTASVLAANKRIVDTALVMKDYIDGSVTIGPDESSLSPMPSIEKGTTAADDDDYDELPFEYDGESETDPRIHIHATGPCNIQALVYEVKETDRRTRKNNV